MLAIHQISFAVLFFGYHRSRQEINEELRIIKAAKKDPHQFAPIYERYFDEIFGFIYKRTLDESLTADLTSQVFYSALYHLDKYKFRGKPFSSWLYRIALNCINEHFRKDKVRQKYITAAAPQIEVFMQEIRLTEHNETVESMVAALLGKLKQKELDIIEMRFFEQMSYSDIGDIVGISESNARIKTFRILKKLRKLLHGKDQNK